MTTRFSLLLGAVPRARSGLLVYASTGAAFVRSWFALVTLDRRWVISGAASSQPDAKSTGDCVLVSDPPLEDEDGDTSLRFL